VGLIGRRFEDLSSKYGVPIVIDKLTELEIKKYGPKAITKFDFYFNLKWENMAGEIDMIVTEKGNHKNVRALVECKSRIYDVCHGFK